MTVENWKTELDSVREGIIMDWVGDEWASGSLPKVRENTDENLKKKILELLRSEEARDIIRTIIADYEDEKKLEGY
jgi:hypothetical protein